MWLRLTVDDAMTVVACEAAMEQTPYAVCPQVAPNFARLAGVSIGPGFNRAVKERVGGTAGCTHLREMLAQMATVAFQTQYGVRARRRRQAPASPAAAPARRPPLLDTCHAYAADGPVARRQWPDFAAGAGTGLPNSASAAGAAEAAGG